MSIVTIESYMMKHYGAPDAVSKPSRKFILGAARILDAANEVITEKKWLNRQPFFVKHTCTVEAIRTASRSPHLRTPDVRNRALLAYLTVQAALNEEGAIGASAEKVTEWNDHPDRTQEMATEVLKAGAHYLRMYVGLEEPKKRGRRRIAAQAALPR